MRGIPAARVELRTYDVAPEHQDDLQRVLRQVLGSGETSCVSLSYGEVARTLSIPAGTVGSRRHRALRRLREALSEGAAGA